MRTCEALIALNAEHGFISWPNAARRRRNVAAFEKSGAGFPGMLISK